MIWDVVGFLIGLLVSYCALLAILEWGDRNF